MGMIAQEVEQKYFKAKAMISAQIPLAVPVTTLIAPPMGGPVQGVLMIDMHHVYTQLDAIDDVLEAMVKAIKKLEDRK